MSTAFKGLSKLAQMTTRSVAATAKSVFKQTGHKLVNKHATSKINFGQLSKRLEKSAKSFKPKQEAQMRDKIIDRISDDLVHKIVFLQYLLEAQKNKSLPPIVQEDLADKIEDLKAEIDAADCVCSSRARLKLGEGHSMYECYGCQEKGHIKEVETAVEGKRFTIKDDIKKIIEDMKKGDTKTRSKSHKSSKGRKTRKAHK